MIHQLQIHHTSFFHFTLIFRKQKCIILKNLNNTNKKSAKRIYWWLTQYYLKLFHHVGNSGNPRKNVVMPETLLVKGESTVIETWYLSTSLVEKLCAEKRI
jgi:hypothetical protein